MHINTTLILGVAPFVYSLTADIHSNIVRGNLTVNIVRLLHATTQVYTSCELQVWLCAVHKYTTSELGPEHRQAHRTVETYSGPKQACT